VLRHRQERPQVLPSELQGLPEQLPGPVRTIPREQVPARTEPRLACLGPVLAPKEPTRGKLDPELLQGPEPT
jgi:hypothetical protein